MTKRLDAMVDLRRASLHPTQIGVAVWCVLNVALYVSGFTSPALSEALARWTVVWTLVIGLAGGLLLAGAAWRRRKTGLWIELCGHILASSMSAVFVAALFWANQGRAAATGLALGAIVIVPCGIRAWQVWRDLDKAEAILARFRVELGSLDVP